MTGSFSSDEPHTFKPTQNCYLAVPEVSEIFELLAGSWLYSAGGSNGWAPPTAPTPTQPHPLAAPLSHESELSLSHHPNPHPHPTPLPRPPRSYAPVCRWSTFNPLARQLAPGYLDWDASRVDRNDIQPDFIDLIWERQGDVWVLVYDTYVKDDRAAAAAAKQAAVPQHSPNHVRLSYSQARVYTWDGYEGSWEEPPADQELLYIQAAPHGWSSARIIFYVQNGRWYENGNIDGKDADRYYSDLRTFLTQNKDFCGRQEPAEARVDCYIAPISCVKVASEWPWSACDKKGPTVKNLNKITRCLVGGDENACNNRGLVKEDYADLYATYHFINLVPLLSEKPQEYAGHNGPLAGIWTWFALFNSLPEAAEHFGTGRPGGTCEHETVEFTSPCLIQGANGASNIFKDCADCGCKDFVDAKKAANDWNANKDPKPWVCLLFQDGCSYTRTSVRALVPAVVLTLTLALALACFTVTPALSLSLILALTLNLDPSPYPFTTPWP